MATSSVAPAAAAEATINLGNRATATALFTYPNDGHENQTLQQTIELYLNSSLSREATQDSFKATAQVSDNACTALISGPDAPAAGVIAQRYQTFFNIGKIGCQDAVTFQKSGKWDPNWKCFLPLGIPLSFIFAIEIMDFPPITLINKQDYLNSKTTSRWWELLLINGVTDRDKCAYSCILDIVPVAAPAGDGAKLDASGIYEGPFDTYDMPLLELLVRTPVSGSLIPLIALGTPIRQWLQRNWNVSLQVGQIDTITLKGGESCNVIGSNHPSFFYYAVSKAQGNDKKLAVGLAVMKQDIVCSAWQQAMGAKPSGDPQAALTASTQKWAGEDKEAELLALVKKQAGLPPAPVEPDAALAELERIKRLTPTAKELEELEKKFEKEGGEFKE